MQRASSSSMPRPPLSLALALALSLSLAQLPRASRAQTPTTYSLPATSASAGRPWAGIGAWAGGGAAKLLYDYDDARREEMLQFLFAPNDGAALQALGIEIGGDGFGGWAAEACAIKFADDDMDVRRGTQLWLAAQARRINPAIVLYAVPFSWPHWMRQSSPDSPFGPTEDEAATVAQYVVDWLTAAKAVWALDFDLVGVWHSPGRAFTADDEGQPLYVTKLAELLANARATLPRTVILCSDGDWSCATYAAANPDTFLPLVAAFGAAGISPGADAAALGNLSANAVPLWSTGYDSVGIAVSSSAISFASMVNNASVFGGLTGHLTVPLASGSYYLGPHWNEGVVQASSPWSGYWFATAFAWAIAHTSRFVPTGPGAGDWRIAAPNTGLAGDLTGLLSGGGSFVFAWATTGVPHFSIIVAKDASATQGDGVTPEAATFVLPPELASQWRGTTVTVVTSEYKFDVGADGGPGNQTLFERSSVLVGDSGQIAVTLWKHSHVTITSLPNGDAAKGSYARPPAPTAFPANWSTSFMFVGEFAECDESGPARFFVDLAGSFECVLDRDWGTPEYVLRQATFEAPISRWRDTRPHTIVGDAQWTDVDLRVTFLLPWATDAALFGVRATSWNASQSEATMQALPGVWVFVNTTGWGVVQALTDASLSHPYAFRAHAAGAGVASGAWHKVRVVARGDALVVAFDGVLAGRVDVPFSAGFPTAGYVALGTGGYEEFVLFNDLAVSALASTCSAVPPEGAQAFIDQCAAGAPGQRFTFAASADRAPSGSFALAANSSLCLEQNATGATLFVFLRLCNATEPRQLWNVERTIEDGPFMTGPVTSAANGAVLDIYYSNYADDSPVDTYSYFQQPNQVLFYDADAGLLQFIQYGVCLTACARL